MANVAMLHTGNRSVGSEIVKWLVPLIPGQTGLTDASIKRSL
jgi:hypothetical protein